MGQSQAAANEQNGASADGAGESRDKLTSGLEDLSEQQQRLQTELSDFQQLLSGIDPDAGSKKPSASNPHMDEFDKVKATASNAAAWAADFLASRSRAPTAPTAVAVPEAQDAGIEAARIAAREKWEKHLAMEKKKREKKR